MFLGLALLAAVIEGIAGYPDLVFRLIGHPVTWIARVISWADERWNSEGGDSDLSGRLQGVALVMLLIGGSLILGLFLWKVVYLLLPPIAALLVCAILASSLPAQRSLEQHVRAVADALDGRGLEAGRDAVAMIVGRDTTDLDESGVATAAIESLAESFSDGVVAPLFWMAVGGLPGALAYKAMNTADSMVGHKTERYRAFGWASARTDDLLNLLPARLATLFLAAAAIVTPGLSGRKALAVAWRDASKHESPNAGWLEASMAGALGIRLAGPRSYGGETIDLPFFNAEGRPANRKDIRTALALYRTACLLQIAVLGVLASLMLLR